MNIYEQIAHNRKMTVAVAAFFVILLLFLGLGFDYYYGAGVRVPVFTVIAAAFGVIASYGSWRFGDKMILSSTRARRLDMTDPRERQWQNVVEEMSIASGIPLPATYIIDDPDPNAFATGRDPQHASIAVTKGLLGALNRDELQAVASHEMSHIRNFDIRLMLMIASLVGAIALLSDWAGRAMFRSGSRGGSSRRSSGGSGSGAAGLVLLAIWLVTALLAPLLSQLMAMFVSRKREYLADASGAELTRNPLALAQALEKISACAGPTRSMNQGTAHLCICDPKGSAIGLRDGTAADLFATHPPIRRRVQALKEMSYAA